MNAPLPAAIRVADVRAGNGPRWIAEGFRMYRRQPVVWTGLSLGWLVISFGLLLVPVIGSFFATLLQPVFFASFAIAAKRQLEGERVEMGDLFIGFRTNVRALAMVGSVELVAALLVILLLSLVMGGPAAPATPATPEDMARSLQERAPLLFTALGLMAIVKGALWFAPALIAFHGMSAPHAIRWSVYASLSNFGAMFTYVFALTLMYVVAALPWGLGFAIALPVMCLSTYTGYRDVFEENAPGPTPAP